MHMLDWADLRYFDSVARLGSLAAAARELGVNHSTVFRRINTLEASLGVKLFERLPTGYALTAAGEEMLVSAVRVGEEITALERRIAGHDYRLSGTVRVTTTDTLGLSFVQPYLFEFYRDYPGIQVELVISNEFFSLTKREADVAIRPTRNPPEELIGRRLCGLAWAVFGSKRYLREKPRPRTPVDLARHRLVCGDDGLAHLPAMRWLARHAPHAHVVYRSNSLIAQLFAVRAGFGLAVLPCFLADEDSDLVRVLSPPPDLMSELWLLTHRDLRQTARVRTFMDFIARTIVRDRALVEGRRSGGDAAKAGQRRASGNARPRDRRGTQAKARDSER